MRYYEYCLEVYTYMTRLNEGFIDNFYFFVFFWFNWVLDRGPEQRESKLTVLCLLIIIILISYIIIYYNIIK
jgi:hypothetical protein